MNVNSCLIYYWS